MPLPVILILILMVISLTGCAIDTNDKATSDYCLIALPIYDSPKDTQKTRDQILAHNARFECVCNGFCPEEQPLSSGSDVLGYLNPAVLH